MKKKAFIQSLYVVVFLFALCFSMIILSNTATATTTKTSGKWTYTYEDDDVNHICITEFDGDNYQGSSTFTFPSTLDGKTVTKIGKGDNVLKVWNNEIESQLITSVVIPEGVVTIGRDAFRYGGFTTITLPSTLETIGASAFCDCYDLVDIIIPDNVEYIGSCAFYDCLSLKTINIPAKLSEVEDELDDAFVGCNSLESFTISPQNTDYFLDQGALCRRSYAYDEENKYLGKIGTYVIAYPCQRKGTFNISKYMRINEFAFVNEQGITAFTISSGNMDYKVVDGVVFDYNIKYLDYFPGGRTGSYTVPEGVTGIQMNAFAYSKISSISMANTVTYIGSNNFYRCPNLYSVSFGRGAVSYYDLDTLPKFTTISVSADNPDYLVKDNILYNKDMTEMVCIPYHSKMQKLIIPDTVIEVDVDIPFSVTSIRLGASIKLNMYAGEVENIPDGENVKTYEVSSSNPYFSVSNGVLYSKDKRFLLKVPSGITYDKYTIPNGVIGLLDRLDIDSLKKITIPKSVIYIKDINAISKDQIIYGYQGSYAQAFAKQNKIQFVALSNTSTKVTVGTAQAPKLSNKAGKKLAINIKKVTGATGYQVQYSLKKNFKGAKSKIIKKVKVTLSKLKKKTYYVRVRAYKISNGKKVYGAFSKVVKIKIKK